MPYALCPMPYALCPMPTRAPHLSEKGYICVYLPDICGFSIQQTLRQNI